MNNTVYLGPVGTKPNHDWVPLGFVTDPGILYDLQGVDEPAFEAPAYFYRTMSFMLDEFRGGKTYMEILGYTAQRELLNRLNNKLNGRRNGEPYHWRGFRNEDKIRQAYPASAQTR